MHTYVLYFILMAEIKEKRVHSLHRKYNETNYMEQDMGG